MTGRVHQNSAGAIAVDDIFCEFTCFGEAGPGSTPVPCMAGQAESYGEYYDYKADGDFPTSNGARALAASKRAALEARVAAMRNCVGQAGCQAPAGDDV